MRGMSLTYDQVLPAEGARRARVTSRAKARDIVSKRMPLDITPKHCACKACELGMPHVRRADAVVVASR